MFVGEALSAVKLAHMDCAGLSEVPAIQLADLAVPEFSSAIGCSQ